LAQTIAVGASPNAIAISPDGKTAYVANSGSATVPVIDAATNTVTKTITAGTTPRAIAISPDGKTAYVANEGSNDVSAIDTATNTVAKKIGAGVNPRSIAITPDGRTIFVGNFGSGSVSAIDTATNALARSITVGGGTTAIAIAITPDTSPVTAFSTTTRARPGVPLTFDASSSKDPDGSIAAYAWSFGDGESQALGTPAATHAFASPGVYTVSLKETDAEGCSTGPVVLFPAGRSMPCTGGAGAQISQPITVAYPGVQVKCPKSAKPRGCAFKLQAIAKVPRRGRAPKAESAIAKARAKAGRPAIVSLIPKSTFNVQLAEVQTILVKETLLSNGKSVTRYVKLRVLR
jgi:YVTN family beta-propeller protein